MIIDGQSATAALYAAAAREPDEKIELSVEAIERVRASRRLLERYIDEERIIYGVTTGVGGFNNWLLPSDKAPDMQENLISAVASNVGNDLADEYVRASMLARINSLARGVSAVQLENLQKYVEIYNAGIVPCIPEKGSLGASGDLGPLAYIALVGTGKWRARYRGDVISGKDALKRAGIEPMNLSYKEGLALINGTSVMVGLGTCLVADIKQLLKTYLLITALSLETLKGKIMPFHAKVQEHRPHPGQVQIAKAVFDLLSDSKMVVQDEEVEAILHQSREEQPKSMDITIEDSYSLRSTPQILGPVFETLMAAEKMLDTELNSATDNPFIDPETEEVYHNGNFHGQYLANAFDQLSILLTTLCNMSERRVERFLDPRFNSGLPPYLCKEDAGLQMGMMGAQMTATSLTAENRSLCSPVSVQTLTCTTGFQDHVSMGLIAARRLREVLVNTYYVVAYELMCGAQAADLREVDELSKATRCVYDKTRETMPYLDFDVPTSDYFEELRNLIASGAILNSVGNRRSFFDW